MTFLAGGVYAWVWIPVACAAAVLTAFIRPEIARNHVRVLDFMVILSGSAILLQLIPLPDALLRAIDPHAISLRTALFVTPLPVDVESLPLPISVMPRDTVAALGIFGTAVLLFWTCRQICEMGGLGRIVRSVALIGLIAAVAAIVQRAESHELLYGFWRPLDAGARPYGPFVNRNHFATWIIMACPLVFGYMLARAPRSEEPRLFAQRLVNALKQLGTVRIWLATSVCIMTLAVLLSASRSGLIGLMTSLLLSTWLTKRRGDVTARRWTAFQVSLLAAVALGFANYDVLLRRVEESVGLTQEGRGRIAIWRDTLGMVQDFPVTGTGAGTYATAINAYQTAEPGYAIGQAHNHYLQLAAEGGVLLMLPALLTAGVFAVAVVRSLNRDRSPIYLVRAGAAAGLAGVMVQNVWETGLRMPANAILFAMLAAIATHGSPPGESRGD